MNEKTNNAKSLVKTREKSKMLAFRLDIETQKKLRTIANRKKATQTKVIRELINIAYGGLYSPVSKELNKLYELILTEANKTKKRKSK